MKKVEVYILTHKEFNEDYDESLYKPILNGSASHKEYFGFIRDDTGDNISNLNSIFSELTGEYWVWKNSEADIYGFCHYRRWFVKTFKFNKITKNDILEDLKEYDIILPRRLNLGNSGYNVIEYNKKHSPNYDVDLEDYKKIEEILHNHFPNYYQYYVDVMNGNLLYAYNMFICDKKLANEYFEWLFQVFDLLESEIDYSKYSENPRIYGFLSERLLTTFVLKNNLRVKEYEILYSEKKLPILPMIYARSPKFGIFEQLWNNLFNKNK